MFFTVASDFTAEETEDARVSSRAEPDTTLVVGGQQPGVVFAYRRPQRVAAQRTVRAAEEHAGAAQPEPPGGVFREVSRFGRHAWDERFQLDQFASSWVQAAPGPIEGGRAHALAAKPQPAFVIFEREAGPVRRHPGDVRERAGELSVLKVMQPVGH